jgi:hypothetical protein
MNRLLQRDQLLQPRLFVWNGPIARQKLGDWARARELEIPTELIDFWAETGGGTLFESETMLGPFADPRTGDDIDSVNEQHHSRGLSRDYLVVHVGSALTAIRMRDQMWVILDDDNGYKVAEEYQNFEGWYRAVLRTEFAARYGLPAQA